MAETGILNVRVFVSNAQVPVKDATVIISKPSGPERQELIAIRRTDSSGNAGPFSLPAPNAAGSLSPGKDSTAFANYTLVVEHPDYQLAVYKDLQIFPNVETAQEVALIPLSMNGLDQSDQTTVTPQPL